jgi:hypothetical protein
MLTCPNCSKPKSSSSTTLTFSIDLNTGQMSSETNKYAKYENILKDSNKSFMFFNSAIMETCKSCKNNYYMTFYYDNKDKKCNGLVFTLEDFQEITTQYYVNSNLDNYLPNANLKRTHADAKNIIELSNVSSEAKMGIIRPLIEAFINYHNNVEEDNKVREGINSVSEKLSDPQLKSALHDIVSDTLKGVHIKIDPLSNNPKDMLLLLETLFTKLYKLPIEEAKLQKEFEDRKSLIEESFQRKISLIKK